MKEIFVFGAGASNASSNPPLTYAPLGKELVWNYYNDCSDLIPEKGGIPDLREEDIRFADYRKFIEMVGNDCPILKPLVEEWEKRGYRGFDPSGYLNKTLYVDELLKIFYEKGNKDAIELTRKLISKHIVGVKYADSSSDELYNEFIKKVLKDKLPEDITTFSFNFDLLLHEDYDCNISFDYHMPFDWVEPVRDQVYRKGKVFPLLKLNGSLDWGICQCCGQIHLYFHHMKEDFYDKQECKRDGCKGNVSPFIIIPHQQGNGKLKGLWSKAQEALREAHKITVIGYSFPDYDTVTRELFRDNMNRDIVLEVIDYCSDPNDAGVGEKIKAKYHKMFQGLTKGTSVRLCGFYRYLSNLKS